MFTHEHVHARTHAQCTAQSHTIIIFMYYMEFILRYYYHSLFADRALEVGFLRLLDNVALI